MLGHAQGIQLVRVFETDTIGGQPVVQLWVAAVSRDEAEAAVQKKLPDGWRAELAHERLTVDTVVRLGLRAGEVRELTS